MEIQELLDMCETLFYQRRNFRGAISTCKKILAIENDNEKALEYMAMSCYELGEYDKAMKLADRWLNSYPENETLQKTREMAENKIKNLEKQLVLLDKSLAEKADEKTIEDKFHTLIDLERSAEAYEFFMGLDGDVLRRCDYGHMAIRLGPDLTIDCLNHVLNDDIEVIDHIKGLFAKYDLDMDKFANQDVYLSWIEKIKSKYDTDVCPMCGARLVPTVYGHPTPDVMDKAQNGEVRLGGCEVSFHDISHDYYYCESCEREFDMGVYGFEIEPDNRLQHDYIKSKLLDVISALNQNTVSSNILHKQVTGLDNYEFSKFFKHLRKIRGIFASESWSQVSLDESVIHKSKSYCDEGKYAAPRWLVYPELSVGTIGWRMGYGESYALNEPPRGSEFYSLFPQPQNWSVNLRNSKLRRFSFLGFLWDLEGKPKYSSIDGDSIEVNDFITLTDEGIFRNDTLFFNSIQDAILRSKSRLFNYYAGAADEDELIEDWDALKYTVCLNACYYKFMENERLRRRLLETGDKCLVYSSDDEWGGDENLFGFALMELRDEIRRLFENEDLIDWEYTEYLKNKNPYENGTPTRDPNDKQSPEYKVIESTFVGASRYVRDVNLDEGLAAKYEAGQIIYERAFVDASNRIGGMTTTHRYLILSGYMADFSKFEEDTNWGLHVAKRRSRFKVVDIYSVGDKTQILLLQLPDGFDGVFKNRTDVEEEFIERERKNFEDDLKKDPVEELSTDMWLQRCEFPIGMDEKGEFFDDK